MCLATRYRCYWVPGSYMTSSGGNDDLVGAWHLREPLHADRGYLPNPAAM
jgi:hypothetical protein